MDWLESLQETNTSDFGGTEACDFLFYQFSIDFSMSQTESNSQSVWCLLIFHVFSKNFVFDEAFSESLSDVHRLGWTSTRIYQVPEFLQPKKQCFLAFNMPSAKTTWLREMVLKYILFFPEVVIGIEDLGIPLLSLELLNVTHPGLLPWEVYRSMESFFETWPGSLSARRRWRAQYGGWMT